jgi:hypothetical protein
VAVEDGACFDKKYDPGSLAKAAAFDCASRRNTLGKTMPPSARPTIEILCFKRLKHFFC